MHRSGPLGSGLRAIWVYADDCDAAIDRLRAAGVAVVDEPADQPRASGWLDPDGNEVMIGARIDPTDE